MENNLFRYVWRNSWREQIIILLVILGSIPFYFASFDVPRRIVNDAIQGHAFRDGRTTATLFDLSIPLPEFLGGRHFVVSNGFAFDQVGHLLALSLLFLVLVLINGAFKYVINVRKGILGERMLRRLRYDLFGQLMRFRPEDIRAVKPAEIASMIKDEVEPVGSFVGDAFVQPAFLGAQALTALAFIMLQSMWLGLVALVIVLIQAIIIPILRREQLRLGRERQLASRRLAGRIGEIVNAAPSVQGHGASLYVKSDISARLGRLFDIRFALYKRKFAVKFLNNLLAQITPFFFYAIGGYFALRGHLDIGQLVAVIAAYRDLPPPIKELIDWDQQRADVLIKYEQVRGQFSPLETLKEEEEPVVALPGRGQIRLDQLQVHDTRGEVLLEPLSLTVDRPSWVALIGPLGGARDILGGVLGRQITAYSGKVLIDGWELSALSVERASRIIGYAGAEIEILQAPLRDSFALSLKRRPPALDEKVDADPRQRRRIAEARRSGNSPLPYDADWTDYAGAGVASSELDLAIRRVLQVFELERDVYELGLNGRLTGYGDRGTNERIIEARRAVSAELQAIDLKGLVETFDPDRYNSNATISENFIFGAVKSDRLANENLFKDPFSMAILQAESLTEPLLHIGSRIASTLAEIFAGLPPGHQLFERFSFAQTIDLEVINELAATVDKRDGDRQPSHEMQQQLLSLALSYIEPRHRLGLVDAPLRHRIMRARASFRTFLPATYLNEVEFYDPEKIIHGATVRDNILFGRVGYSIADASARVSRVVERALARSGLDSEVYRLGLDTDTGVNGRYLSSRLRLAIPLTRAMLKRPDIYVLDLTPLLAVVEPTEEMIARLQDYCRGKTLVTLVTQAALVSDADYAVEFAGARGHPRARAENGVVSSPRLQKRLSPEAEPAGIGAGQ